MLRKHLTVAPLLILMMSVFRGHTLKCHQTEYQNGDQCCPTCSAGSRVRNHCTEFRPTSCLDCDEGTFMDRPTGLTECFPCVRCISDFGLKMKTACTTTSDTVCEPLEGFYCLYPIEDDCVEAQKHSSCQPGQYISQKGTALRDTECSDCRDGTFSDGTLLTSCQPHTQCQSLDLQLIKPGTASTDAECGEQSSGAVIGAVVGGLVTCLVVGLAIALFLVWRLKKKKDTERKRNADNPQQYFKKNMKKKLQEVAMINKHRDSSSDPSEESSMFDKI
ncbi:tumor necrosis factor receptor superfamily member 14-like [Perca fluviatilis]|uniref:tumor necrosis factor receptor superfamily member 14-like n=1 Tax=Perca fluviatilis TaxID=8168 RepID=UPI0019640C94|nr:tumor necrosis factor receptor superfamily member 14-like [Perca fluviatilis]XP_039656622.1 tumor necrosis factor receptor superfamily member 14-like [Perca fluviatilis]